VILKLIEKKSRVNQDTYPSATKKNRHKKIIAMLTLWPVRNRHRRIPKQKIKKIKLIIIISWQMF